MRNPLRVFSRAREEQGVADLTPGQLLRIKMWEARSSHSRSTGLAFLGISGVFLAVSFLTSFAPSEILAIASFVVGVFLISVELEPRVKLVPSAESLFGPLLALSNDLAARGFDGNTTYASRPEGVTMRVSRNDGSPDYLDIEPVGRGLSDSIEREVGPLKDAEFSYVMTWVPKAIEKGLDLADEVKIRLKEGTISVDFDRPFVRPLCVREDFNRKVCRSVGCPLVGSLGEILALSTGNNVEYHGCTYDRSTEASHALYELKRGQ